MIKISDQDVVLFQGDSITDAGRDRSNPNCLGHGYANMAASWYAATYPERDVQFINRGISGNRAKDLEKRWEEDCIALKPTVVSIMIGINDCWRRYDSHDPTSAEDYAQAYQTILEQTKENTDARLILCEPFVLPHPPDREQWREDLDPKIQVVRQLAREYHAVYLPFDGILHGACTYKAPSFWAEDGVHPTPAGHALLAKAWLQVVSPC